MLTCIIRYHIDTTKRGQRLNPSTAAGIVTAIVGVVLINWPNARRARPA
ncbi:hypothetical protein QKW60_09925 [Defluviimonas aestuarii]|nr:hypothetical protein [Defluviimonas aestuarii]MDI3336725.1 hypothetical protein [Defluviimonas aestuarii]